MQENIINGLSFDIEEWFQVENLRPVCPVEKWNAFESRVQRNTGILLDLLAKYGHKATFFILGWVAEKTPALVKEIFNQGHEVASHGYKHDIVYSLTPAEFRKDLERSKKILEDITGNEVIGYRAPNFSINKSSLWALDILKEFNFQYDSSIFPFSCHDRYGDCGVNDSTFFKFENGLQEFPLTVYKLGRFILPLGGGAYFRIIPYRVFRLMLKRINKLGKQFVFYFHPWEVDKNQPRMKIKKEYYFRHYTNLGKAESKLGLLMRDFKFSPLKSLLNK
ncbi:XrtA system polysaccharide deacetylase [Candidatus Omnitrophota bacterium]